MAFIRKHRVVLMPLFVVAIAGLGLFFLLRSQSEEPVGNVSSAYPRETVQAWQEDISKRSQHGREYAFVRTVEYVDPETEEVVTEETVSTVCERGTNVCYKDASGDWVPTVAEWGSGGLGFKMDKNSWRIEVPMTLGSAYEYTVGGRTLAMRPSTIGLSDGQQSIVLGPIDTSVIGQIDPDDPSKLVFADVLGTNSGVDLELVLEWASLHQNVVLRGKPALPEGFDAQNTRLYVYTELGLDALTAAGDVNVWVGDTPVNVSANDLVTARNTNEPITFTVERTVDGTPVEAPLHRFVESRVWDSTGIENETVAARQLWRSPVDHKTYLVESLPYSYIADATGAVTLDYENQSGTIDEDETWTADATYYVTGDVVIGAGKTLTIEPGTVVKFAEDTQINAGIYETESGAKIVAKGEPYNYIVFTSDTDDNCGEDLTPGESTSGTSSYYTLALEVGRYGDVTSEIEYCKAAFGLWGFVTSRRINSPVAHCIVYECWCGILVCRGESTTASDVFNCLITDCFMGVCAWMRDPTSQEFTIQNCTIADDCGYGIRIHLEDSDPTPSVEAKDNLITACLYAGITRTGDGSNVTWDLDYNGFWDNDDDFEGIDSEDQGTHNVVLGASPYDADNTQLGSFFIDTGGGGSSLVNVGSDAFSTIYGSGAQFDVEPPDVVDSDITSNATWWDKRSVDTGTVDIGYHHPRVDYVIDDTVIDIGSSSNTVTLELEEGVVVAFYGSSATLQFLGGATQVPTLTCNGDCGNPIVMAGAPSVSMGITTKRDGNSNGALVRNPVTAAEVVSITYCRFVGLHTALQVSETSADEILHCAFERNGKGVYCVYLGYPTTFTLKNCLFQNNDTGCLVEQGYGSSKLATLRNCTFDRSDKGIYYVLSDSPYGRSLTIKDCLFTNCTTSGVYLNYLPGTFAENYNAYWNCEVNVYNDYSGEPLAIGDDSIVLTSDPYDPDWFDPKDPASANWRAQRYLDQDGDCIDAGSDYSHVAEIALSAFTTSLGGEVDIGKVDIGYHYEGVAGVEESYLLVGGDPAESAFFTSSTTLQIYVDFATDGGTWDLYIDDAPTPMDSGTGDMNGVELSLSEWYPGWYTITITYSVAGTDEIVFRIYIDDAGPTGFSIKSPEADSTISGY